MQRVTVKKADLLKTLELNMAKHGDEFEEAWENYRKAAIHELEQRLDAVKEGKPFKLWFNLTAPENHTDDYVRAIEMLDWEIEDEVELTQADFTQFIKDDWGWKSHFIETSNSLLSYTVDNDLN